MANKPGKRQFGSARRLPSGRWQVRYVTPDGEIVTAPTTFTAKGDAGRFLDAVRTDLERGHWVDPNAGRIILEAFARRWLQERPLRPRTKELYEGLLDLHILPALGALELNRITGAKVRSWHADLLRRPYPGDSTAAKAYRLLRSILNTAVEDGRIAANPCQIDAAGRERPAERPVATVAEVYALADAVGAEHRLLVLLACFAGLRLGELQALRRRHVDLDRAAIRVAEQTLVLPELVVDELRKHLVAVPDDPEALVLGRPGNRPFRRATLYTAWHAATKRLGMEGFRIHDLRHTGNTLAAATGASTKELMARMGHVSPRAALIYQHATRDRDVVIAKALDGMIREVLDREWHANGTPTESTTIGNDAEAGRHSD